MSATAGRAAAGAVALLLALVALAATSVVRAAGSVDESDGSADAVVALAGDRQRLDAADELARSTGGRLVISWVPGTDPDRDEWCAADRSDALCFLPEPVSTAGEARAIGTLADERGWEDVLVVTARHHAKRADLLIGQCVDETAVGVVSASDRLRSADVLKESLGVLSGATLGRAC